MAQRPTFPSPFLNAIDATVDNEFTCLINDKDIITKYSFEIIKIPENDEKDLTVYEYNGAETIYGGNGNNSYLIITVPANTLENEKEYKWKVTLTDSYDYTVESREYYFNCIAEPILKLTSEDMTDNIINIANATFKGEYICTFPLVYHRFILKKDDEIIYDTGEVYSQNLIFQYDMYFQGDYTLTFQVENEGKVKVDKTIEFTVDYTNAPTNIVPVCINSKEDNSIIIDLSNIVTIPGTYTPNTEEYNQIDVSETLKGVYIPKNTSLYWQEKVGVSDGLNIDEDKFSLYLMLNLPHGRQGEIIRLSGDNEILISFDGFKLYYEFKNGNSGHVSIYENDEYFLGNIPIEEEIDNTKIYAYDFHSDTEYNFNGEYKYVFQNPMNMYWWLILITPNEVKAMRGAEANV